MIRRFMVIALAILALTTGSLGILSFWMTTSFDAALREKPGNRNSLDHGVWLHVNADQGWFDIDFHIGMLMGGSCMEEEKAWWGSFNNCSRPGSIYWWIMMPAWEPAAFCALLPCYMLLHRLVRRHRRRRNDLCMSCGYNLTGNVSGICPECGENT